MTCIVGIEADGKVYLGGDSLGSSEHLQQTIPEPKVFENGPFLIGIAGSFRWGQLLEHALIVTPQPGDVDDRKFMVTTFIDAVRKTMLDGGYMAKEDEFESAYGDALVGYRGRLYVLEGTEFHIRRAREYAAVGCGEAVALGALHATRGKRPKDRLKIALEAAAEHVPGVRGPFHFVGG